MNRRACLGLVRNLRVLSSILLLLSIARAEPSLTSTTAAASVPSAVHTRAHVSPSPTPATKPAVLHETCRSASVNHITNQLPQQCWTGSTSKDTATVQASGNSTALATVDGASVTPIQLPVHPQQSISTSTQSSISAIQDEAQQSASTTSSLPVSSSAVLSEATDSIESEVESPLDNAKFLSFEEWKKHHLEQAGAGPDALANEKKTYAQDRKRPGINNALDGLGDESEIAFDFNPFGGSSDPSHSGSATPSSSLAATTAAISPLADVPHKRSKDAGKTCKERSNFASFDCAANVLKTNPKCKSSSSILVENKDSYMLNECAMNNKFLIVELCENVLIDTVVLANFEFFSSMFRTFRVSGSSHYPPKPDQWIDLGTFEARNSRDIQAFLIEPPRYARYLRVEFLTHYGSEYYCPVSLLRVHGMTMYEEFVRSQHDVRDNDEEDQARGGDEVLSKPAQDTVTVVTEVKEDHVVSLAHTVESKKDKTDLPSTGDAPPSPADQSASPQSSPSATAPADVCLSTSNPAPSNVIYATPEKCASDSKPPTSTSKKEVASTQQTSTASSKSSSNIANSVRTSVSGQSSNYQNVTNTSAYVSSSAGVAPSNATETIPTTRKATTQSASNSVSSPSTLTATQNNLQPAQAPPSYQPPTQESFFKSMHKRLLALEANATLSLQYIESQSALLRDAFAKVEKRQLLKTSKFLDTLNVTVTNELARFKADYDKLWQSAVMQLASQREEGRRERELLGERVKVLAEEMVNQKRLMAAQATLLLLCLGLVIFGKLGATGPYVDSGLLQGMQEIVLKAKQAKLEESQTAKRPWKWESPWSSPTKRSKTSPGDVRQNHVDLGMHNESERHDAQGAKTTSSTPDHTTKNEE